MAGVHDAARRTEWHRHHSPKRRGDQAMQLGRLGRVPARRVHEIRPSLGRVTALPDDEGDGIETLELGPRGLAPPAVPRPGLDLTRLAPAGGHGRKAVPTAPTRSVMHLCADATLSRAPA